MVENGYAKFLILLETNLTWFTALQAWCVITSRWLCLVISSQTTHHHGFHANNVEPHSVLPKQEASKQVLYNPSFSKEGIYWNKLKEYSIQADCVHQCWILGYIVCDSAPSASKYHMVTWKSLYGWKKLSTNLDLIDKILNFHFFNFSMLLPFVWSHYSWLSPI